jgi:hypothetical protein
MFELMQLLSKLRLNLTLEKETQKEIAAALVNHRIDFTREHALDEKNIPDFFINGLVMEVKLKGTAKQIYRQCQRYCEFDEVKELLLVTNKSMGLPEYINGKRCRILRIGKAWL